MDYSLIADTYERIEFTTKRLEMTNYLVGLFKLTPRSLIDKVVYLTQGKLYPDFVDVEIGIADKLAIRTVAKATGLDVKEIKKDLEKTGDVGKTIQNFLHERVQVTLFREPLTVQRVYGTLERIAKTTGVGAVEQKIDLLFGLLTDATPKEAKYIIRNVTGKLRLGIADMTVLDALALSYGGGKEARDELERAYNISSDLGGVAKTLVEKGLEAIKRFEISLGNPIRSMLAEKLGSPHEILEKLGGRCIAEFKYDGERIQAHKNGDHVILFSRRLENITAQYPDGVELFKKYLKVKDAIVEAECVAVDQHTGQFRPFQELMHRRRKHEIKKAVEEYPISLFLFDALYVNGIDLSLKPYFVRHKKLEELIENNENFRLATYLITDDPNELESFFEKAVKSGCEGLVCKSIGEGSVYQAGARGWLWIKYKRDYKSEMAETFDLVIVGALHGRGKRAGTYGALLLAAYDPDDDSFKTLTKCGTGFTDEDLRKLPKMMARHRILHKHPRVNSTLQVDTWFEPKVVIEITGSEMTLSPIHTCARDIIRQGSGLAIRFPRFTGKYRLDKSAEDATTVNEIIKLYQSQFNKLRS